MNSVEQAIRAALAKGDAGDQGFRRRIYGSASAALERSLAARPFTESEILARRQHLLSTIRTIETDFLAAVENDRVDMPEVLQPVQNAAASATTSAIAETVPARVSEVETKAFQPNAASVLVNAPDRADRYAQKQTSPVKAQTPAAPKAPAAKIKAPGKKRPWFKYALNGGFLLLLLVGGAWAYGEGKRIYNEATTSKPASSKPVLAESSDANTTETTEWIQIFSANDTDLISAPEGAKAEISSRDGNNYVVMSGDGSKEVSVKIGAGLMKSFAGKRVLFNITARSTNGAILDTGAHCAFGAETKCARKRFKVGPEAADYMFAVTVAASANGDGALLIAPDLTGGGGTVEIENIRATLVEPDAG